MRYFICFIVSFAILIFAQKTALQAVGGSTNKSESNFFSSLARIQTGIGKPQADIYLTGSSITGRLPDRSEGFSGVANLGCDGGSSVDVLRGIDEGKIPAPKLVIIEGNRIFLATGGKRSEIAKEFDTPRFQLGIRHSLISATARPSAFFYSALMSAKFSKPPVTQLVSVDLPGPKLLSESDLIAYPEHFSALVEEMTGILKRFRARGIQSLLVMLPEGHGTPLEGVTLSMAVAFKSEVPYWNLAEQVDPGEIRYTDATHMDSPSATFVLKQLLKQIPPLK